MRNISQAATNQSHSTSGHVLRAAVLIGILWAGWVPEVTGAEADILWGFDGVKVSEHRGGFQHISDGAGGAYIAFATDGSYPDYEGPVFVVHYNAQGTVAWGPLLVSGVAAAGQLPRICPDGSGGVMVAWAEEVSNGIWQVKVQRVSGGGTILWASPLDASSASIYEVQSLAVGGGSAGMFLVYRNDVALYGAYLSAAGVLALPGTGGLSLGSARVFGAEPCMVADGSGGNGIIVAWSDIYRSIKAQHLVLAGGTLVQAWGPAVTVCDTAGDGYYPTLAQDGSGGALVSWTEVNLWPPARTEIRVQKITSSGVAQWAANGVVVVDSVTVGGPTTWQTAEVKSTVARDGGGGAYVAWNDWRNATPQLAGNDDIYAQMVNAFGSPQWASGGISISDFPAGSQRRPSMVSDIASGALVTFQDYYGSSWDIAIVRLSPVGKSWFRWAFWDSSFENEDQQSPAVIYDGSGADPKGCIVAWNGQFDISAQKVALGASAANIALTGTATIGTSTLNGVITPVVHEGTTGNINDGDLSTRVDTWNQTGADPLSYVGILWTQPQVSPVLRVELTFATFGDGGWFGPVNLCPGPGGLLSPTYLSEPEVQVTTDGGATWTKVAHTSDYLTALNGHGIGGGAYPNPSSAKAIFMLNPPKASINGIRLIGSEGGIASSGFLGVFELAVYNFIDSDSDGMDDAWEVSHSLIVGSNDAAIDADSDRLSNLQEFLHSTDPHKACTDGDKFCDGVEVQLGSNPTSSGSMPSNLARRLTATGILGTMNAIGGIATPVYFAGSQSDINDGILTNDVNTYNGPGAPDPLSYVGIVWSELQPETIAYVGLDVATYFDGGWFGPNNAGPGVGGVLSGSYLTVPTVQVSTDGGATWITVTANSDYLSSLEGHMLPSIAYGSPTHAAAGFILNPPQAGINGIRLIGSEGGTASGGFLGIFEFSALTEVPLKLMNCIVDKEAGTVRFQFDTEAGHAYDVQLKELLVPGNWKTVDTIRGDGTRKTAVQAYTPFQRSAFFRVVAREE